MRRKDREVKDISEIISIIQNCDVCRVAFFDEPYPYIVPMNFGFQYENGKFTLYFHCAKEGKKLDLLNKNNKVFFEMDSTHKLITGENACDYTMEFESVCGTGELEAVGDDQKPEALTHLMAQYSARTDFTFPVRELNSIHVLRLNVHEITAKRLRKK